MKVAMITAFPDEPQHIAGGVAGVAKYLSDEFSKVADLRLTVVAPQGTNQKNIVCEQWGGVAVYRLPRAGPWKFLPGTVYDIFAGRRQVTRFISRIEPDIVHFQGGAFLASGCRRRKVLTIHGIAEKDAVWDMRWGVVRWLKWLVLKLTEDYGRRRTPHVILISDTVANVLPRSRSRKIWRINNPIADSFFDVAWQAEPGRIFCCSRISPLKNIIGMIKAFGQAQRRGPDWRLRIAGTGDPGYMSACRKQVEKDGLQSCVHFLGNLSVTEVQRELSKANCFALASLQEISPLAVAEAMAVGVPVVAAGVGGIPEMVDHGRTGFLVNPRDPRDIGDALDRILSDPELARAMGRRAKDIARARYMASSVAQKTVDAYRQIIGSGALQTGSAA